MGGVDSANIGSPEYYQISARGSQQRNRLQSSIATGGNRKNRRHRPISAYPIPGGQVNGGVYPNLG